MLIPDITKPMHLVPVLEQADTDAMHRRVAPAFVEEAAGAVQVLKVPCVGLGAPEVEGGDFKVAPEVAGRVAVCLLVVARAVRGVRHPAHGVVGVEVLCVVPFGQEALGFGPQCWDGGGAVVEVDGEAVGLVALRHVAEDVVVDVAEEVDVGLHAPVVCRVLEGRVDGEEAGVPAAHLVVGKHLGILDAVCLEDRGGFFVEFLIDPWRRDPVLVGDEVKEDVGFCFFANGVLELLRKGDVVEEGPRVVEFRVERAFQVAHRLYNTVELFVAHEGEECCVDAGGLWIVRCIIVALYSPERSRWFINH